MLLRWLPFKNVIFKLITFFTNSEEQQAAVTISKNIYMLRDTYSKCVPLLLLPLEKMPNFIFCFAIILTVLPFFMECSKSPL